MKRKLVSLALVIVLILSCLPSTALAADDDWSFIDNGDGTATITSYNGSDENVTTPDTLGGLPVTMISTAFAGNTSIKNVIISEGVTQLGDQRVVPDTVPTYDNFRFFGYVFDGCEALESVSLPSTLVEIGIHSFTGCTSLETITVASGNDVFTVDSNGVLLRDSNDDDIYDVLEVYPAGKSDLTSYTTPAGVTVIATGAFMSNEYLTSVTLSDDVTQLGDLYSGTFDAPYDGTGEPTGLLSATFANCPNLATVSFPANLETMGLYSFFGCDSLNTVSVASGNTKFKFDGGVLFSCDDNDGLVFNALEWYPLAKSDAAYTVPETVTRLIEGAFQDNEHLQTLTISENIGYCSRGVCYMPELTTVAFEEGIEIETISGFEFCPKLSNVTLPDSVTHIASGAFEWSEALTTINLEVGLQEIGDLAFAHSGLTEITIPSSVTFIDDWAFDTCFSLEKIEVAVGNMNYKDIDGVLYTLDGKDLIQYPRGVGWKTFNVPVGVETIHGGVFNGAGLDEITLPNGIIGLRAGGTFASNNFQRIDIPASVEYLSGEYDFSDNPNLTQFVVHSSTATYGDDGIFAFDGSPNVVLYGLEGSTTKAYADKYELPFSLIASAISLDKSTATLLRGSSLTLNATTTPSEGCLVTWSSSNASVASVNKSGKVTANTAGTATITASCLDQTATCVVSVTPDTFTVSASANNAAYGSVTGAGTYAIGATAKLTAAPANGYRFVRWTENGSQVSTSATYTFTVSKNTAVTAEFTALKALSISCTKTDATVYGTANGSVTVTASGGDSGAYEYSINGGASWQGSNTFSGLGTATYTAAVRDAAYPSNIATCSVSVGQPAYIGNVPVNKVPSKAAVDTAITVTPPAAPKGYTPQSVTFTSSNPAVATVDASGNVTFLAGGKVTIITKVVSQTVDKKGKVKIKTTTVKKTITVNQLVENISLNLGNTTIARTQKVKLMSSVAPATASNKKLTWKSSNPKVAAVSSSGVVTGKAGGTAIITCTAKDGSGAAASCTVNVTPIYPTGLKMSKSALTVKLGKTAALKATIAPKNTDYKTVTWTSSNPAVATVDAKGKVKAVASGTAVITATTSNGIAASCTVTVP